MDRRRYSRARLSLPMEVHYWRNAHPDSEEWIRANSLNMSLQGCLLHTGQVEYESGNVVCISVQLPNLPCKPCLIQCVVVRSGEGQTALRFRRAKRSAYEKLRLAVQLRLHDQMRRSA